MKIRAIISRIIPDSLLSRLILILIIPTIITQSISAYIFYERHWSNVSEKMINYLAGEIIVLYYATEGKPDSERNKILQLAKENMRLGISYQPGKKIKKNFKKQSNDTIHQLYNEIKSKIYLPITVAYIEHSNDIEVNIQLRDGLLTITVASKRFSNPTTYIFILWMSGTAFITLLIAIIFCRNQVRSMIKLADAAEKFGKNIEFENFRPSGAKEVRKVATAFLVMKERIKRQLSQRTEMLTSVSHDLRTLLTRMKLQIAMAENEEGARWLKKDITEMEEIINHYLDFARGEGGEIATSHELGNILNEIVASYQNTRINIVLVIEEQITLMVKISALKRAMSNLIQNSIDHASRILIKIYRQDKEAVIEIHDNGPGVPLAERDNIFTPFYRLDTARNMDRAGAGLGLAITRDIINNHGGKIILADSEILNGLKIVMRLPV